MIKKEKGSRERDKGNASRLTRVYISLYLLLDIYLYTIHILFIIIMEADHKNYQITNDKKNEAKTIKVG